MNEPAPLVGAEVDLSKLDGVLCSAILPAPVEWPGFVLGRSADLDLNAAKRTRRGTYPNAYRLKRLLRDDGWRTPDTYDSDAYLSIPFSSGVYAFVEYEDFTNRVLYVGMSRCIAERLANSHPVLAHLRSRLPLISRWHKQCPEADLRATERRYIELFQPPLNIVGRQKSVT